MTGEEIDRRFMYHSGTADQQAMSTRMRDAAITLAKGMVSSAPASRELSSAITHLETAMFWYNAAVYRPPGK